MNKYNMLTILDSNKIHLTLRRIKIEIERIS